MESTEVYWKQLFVVLQEHEIEVYLINSRHVKNVTGKNTDEKMLDGYNACMLVGFLATVSNLKKMSVLCVVWSGNEKNFVTINQHMSTG